MLVVMEGREDKLLLGEVRGKFGLSKALHTWTLASSPHMSFGSQTLPRTSTPEDEPGRHEESIKT